MKEDKKINGLNERHVAQIVRRKMIQRVKPSAKVYKRNKNKNTDQSGKYGISRAVANVSTKYRFESCPDY